MTDNAKEAFIGFTNVTGNTTGDVIIEKVESFDLNLSNIRAWPMREHVTVFIFNTHSLEGYK